MYKELMIDWETLSLDPETAPVLSVGIVVFNLDDEDSYDTLDSEDRSQHTTFDVQSQLDAGRKMSYDVVRWWIQQGKMAQNAVFKETGYRVHKWLYDFYDILGPMNVWGNGSIFDVSLLESLSRTFDVPIPKLMFRQTRDLRTLRYLAGNPNMQIPRGTAHDALEDAKYQVLCAQAYWRMIHGGHD